jgi:hypothetical protein
MKMFKSLFIIYFLTVLFSNDVILADEQSLINDSGMISELPNGLKFFVDVNDEEEISDIAVKFRVLDRSAVQYDYFDLKDSKSSNRKEYYFNTSAANSYIPPGSLVEYYFEIFNSDNESIKTDPVISRVLDSRFEWDSVKSDNIEVFFHGPVRKRALRILNSAENLNTIMKDILTSSKFNNIVVTMYNNNAEMFDAIVHKSSKQSRELITEGQAFDRENVVLVQGAGRRSVGTATHELTHVLVARASKGSLLGVPLWLNEGLAEYGNLDPGHSYDRFLEWAVDTERLMPFTSLNRFPGEPSLTIVAYGQSKNFVEFIINKYGADKIQKILDQLSEGKKINGSFESVLGLDLIEVENLWRKEIGAKPLKMINTEIKPKQGGTVPILKPYSLTPEPKDSKLTEKIQDDEKVEVQEEIVRESSSCNASGGKSIDISFLVLIGLIIVRLLFRKSKLVLPKRVF